MTVDNTRVSLIERVCDHRDEEAWNDFAALYAPLIYSYGLKRGLQDSDAADLAQDVLQIVIGAVKKFDFRSRRGSFRGWLLTITLNRIRRKHIISKRQVAGSGRTTVAHALQHQAEQEQLSWDREIRFRLFEWAAEQVRGEFQAKTWQAFWLTSVEGQQPADVAIQLQMSLGSVYVAKSRIVARIREKAASADELQWNSS